MYGWEVVAPDESAAALLVGNCANTVFPQSQLSQVPASAMAALAGLLLRNID